MRPAFALLLRSDLVAGDGQDALERCSFQGELMVESFRWIWIMSWAVGWMLNAATAWAETG